MNTDTTQAEVDANCKMIRQLKWLQQEYWDSYEYEINKLVEANEDLLKKAAKHAQSEQLGTAQPEIASTPANFDFRAISAEVRE